MTLEEMKDLSAQEQKALFYRLKVIRSEAKTVNYAATYGSGAKTMSRTSGMSLEKCKKLIESYWERNWSLKEVENNTVIKQCLDGMWLYNPISKFWYSLRHEKDKFSTLNQGSGTYLFDHYVRCVRKREVKICGQFHDEWVATVKSGNRDILTKIAKDSIDEVNRSFNLNRDMDIDIQFGDAYKDIH